jgi:hypothetical protein
MNTRGNDEGLLCATGDLERKLWLAVLVQAVEDWRSNNMQRHREAEAFFFQCGEDFACVCSSAGLDPQSLKERLEKLKPAAQAAPVRPCAVWPEERVATRYMYSPAANRRFPAVHDRRPSAKFRKPRPEASAQIW